MRRNALALALVAFATPAPAMQLTLRDSFVFPRAASMEWDPLLCGLWVAIEGPQVFLLTPGGDEIRRLEPGLRVIRSLTVEEGGLLLADGWGGFLRVDRNGAPRGGQFRLADGLRDVEGIARQPDGSYLIVEDDVSRLIRIGPDGTLLREKFGSSFSPRLEELQGVARDPLTGNVLVVDDNEGLNALVELTPDWEVISVTPLSEWGYDAEGVAVHAQTGTLYIGFESGRRIAIFDYLPTRDGGLDAGFDQGPDCAIS